MANRLLFLLLWCATCALWLILLERAGVPSIAVAPVLLAALVTVVVDRLAIQRAGWHKRAKHRQPNICQCVLPSSTLPAAPSQLPVAFGPHWRHWKAGVMATYGGQEEFDKACAVCVSPEAPVCRVAGTRTGHLIHDDGTFIRGQFLLRKGEFVPHGYALRVSADGAIHEGEWLAGEPEGMGFRTTPDGRVAHGYWSGEKVDTQWNPPLWF
nr:hypothetical protein [Pandoravirus massiliensis]